MPEALRARGIDEQKLAGVLRQMLDDEEFTPADRRWAAEESLKLLAAYPARSERDIPTKVEIISHIPRPQREESRCHRDELDVSEAT